MEALTGKQFARYWIHSSMIVEGQKMSSPSNFYTLGPLEQGYRPAIRYLPHQFHFLKQVELYVRGVESRRGFIDRLVL
jgi:cysteinyl-tRNA synthetase